MRASEGEVVQQARHYQLQLREVALRGVVAEGDRGAC